MYDDIGALAEIGAAALRARRGASGHMRMHAPPRPPMMSAIPGVGGGAHGVLPLGMGFSTATGAGALLANLVARPQKPFKGRRLILEVQRVVAVGVVVFITQFIVGVQPVNVGAAGMLVSAFANTATDIVLDIPPCPAGVDITLFLAFSIPLIAGDTITIGGTLIGDSFT